MSLIPISADSPVIKIGAVVVRRVVSEEETLLTTHDAELTTYQILIIQPIPKNKGELPHFVLPRGSRQYQLHGEWIDARDVATAERYRDALEPFTRALMREIEEEAGVSPAQLEAAQVLELDALPFQSRCKGIYPIHWFVVVPDAATASLLAQQRPVDALEVRWATLTEIKAMAARGDFSAGYVPVIEAALALIAGAESEA